MYELREEAQLPWRMIAKSLGLQRGQRAGEYYRQLKKVYGGT